MSVKLASQYKISINNEDKIYLLRHLQAIESVEIVTNDNPESLGEEELSLKNELLDKLDRIDKSIDIFLKINPIKKNILSGLLDFRVKIKEEEFKKISSNQDDIISEVDYINKISEEKEDLYLRNRILKDIIKKVEPLKNIELDIFDDFKYIDFIPFMIGANRSHYVLDQIENLFPNTIFESIKKIDKEYVYLIAFQKNDYKEIYEFISSQATVFNFRLNNLGNSFYEIYNRASDEIKLNQDKIESISKDLSKTKINLEQLYTIKDILKSQINIIDELHNFNSINNEMSYIRVWVSEENIHKISVKIKRLFKNYTFIESSTIKGDAPVIMTNNKLVSNFESITKIMGMPKGGSIDPTFFVAFFFTFMFGLALSEAGYAVVLILIVGFLLTLKNLKESIRAFMLVILFSSITTLIVGAMFGSWFGVVPDDVIIYEDALPHMKFLIDIGLIGVLQKLQVLNPMSTVVSLMVFTVVIGLIHLLLGLILGFVREYSRGNALNGALDSLSWFFLIILGLFTTLARQNLLGEGLYYLSSIMILILIGYSVIMIFVLGRDAGKNIFLKFGKGLYDMFFGIIGYLSDTLSYTRLIALGLATGIIAGVVGTLARLAGEGLVDKGGVYIIIGYIIMTVIFVFGHIFNIALNVLGTYINVGRLHFVEFFSKFFESGGREISYLKRSQEFIKIEK